MHRIALAFALLLACFAAVAPASAQPQRVGVCLERVDANGSNQCSDISATNPFPVLGTFSASGFSPSVSGARGTPVSVTTSDSSGTLPTGAVVAVTNVGATNPMYCNVNGVAATTSDQYISANGGWFAFTIPATVTTLHCIATGGTTTANMVGGSGLATGTGGGSGGGGGGAITAADGAIVTLGAEADAACGSDTGTCTQMALIKRQLQTLTSTLTAVQAAVPAGTNNIGNVGLISQYPTGAVPITASNTGTTGATTATLAASASIKTYICGFSIRANATGATTNNSTITGTVTGTLNFSQWTAPLASGIGLTEQIFSPCIPSSAINTGIAVISGAPGSGGVVSVSAWGYQL